MWRRTSALTVSDLPRAGPKHVVTAACLLLTVGMQVAQADEPAPAASPWTYGGEYRLRADRYEHADFGLHDAAAFTSWQQRFWANVAWRPDATLRVFVQAGAATESGRLPGPREGDRSAIDLAQAYVDAQIGPQSWGWRARLGRQEVTEGRYISIRELTNLRRTFDGLRLDGPVGEWTLAGLVAHVTRNRTGAFDDDPSPGDQVAFVRGEQSLPVEGLLMGLSVMKHDVAGARYAAGTGSEHRWTWGARVHGQQRGWDVDTQASWQGGTFSPAGGTRETIRAWGAMFEGGLPLDTPWHPRLAVRADLASGDGSANDGRFGTFDLPYPNLSYLNDAVIVAPRNIRDFQPFIVLQPTQTFNFTLGVEWLWRNERADSVYTPAGTPLIPPGPGGNAVATLPYVRWRWVPAPHLEIQGGLVHGSPREALRAAGGRRSLDYGYVSMSVRL